MCVCVCVFKNKKFYLACNICLLKVWWQDEVCCPNIHIHISAQSWSYVLSCCHPKVNKCNKDRRIIFKLMHGQPCVFRDQSKKISWMVHCFIHEQLVYNSWFASWWLFLWMVSFLNSWSWTIYYLQTIHDNFTGVWTTSCSY